jgi:hypothetical protein
VLPLPRSLRIIREWLRDPRNPDRCFDTFAKLSRYFYKPYRFAWPFLDWYRDASFNEYLSRFDELDGYNTHRRWMLAQLIRFTSNISGDTAECGVYRGSTSYLILEHNARCALPRHHFMFDSFGGLSKPTKEDGNYWTEGDLSTSENNARKALQQFGNKTFLTGWIPQRFDEVASRRFSFVHIDVDLFQPTKDSLAFFYPRLESGAVLICDDYGCSTCQGATQACDQFLESCPEKMISLPDGGGFFIKGTACTAATAE